MDRIPLSEVYYKQARALKEWVMAIAKAEPCHILLIPLNSSQENVDNAKQRLQNLCNTLKYPETVIRQLNDYLPADNKHLSLIPYAKALFAHEDPLYSIRLLKGLSPIRLYLYGNESSISSEWSKLMISSEIQIMEDEDSWCAFLENEPIENDIKWNLPFMFGRQWNVPRVAPLDFARLGDELRFHSALRRAFVTFSDRQIEVTAEIFNWYDGCIAEKHLLQEPRLSSNDRAIKHMRPSISGMAAPLKYRFIGLSTFDYSHLLLRRTRSISFVWLDSILRESNDEFDRMIEPAQWQFFNEVSGCLAFIETQLREQRYVFFVTSGAFGEDLLYPQSCLIKQVFALYIYCGSVKGHTQLTKRCPQIRGVFDDSEKLANSIRNDLNELKISLGCADANWAAQSQNEDNGWVIDGRTTQVPVRNRFDQARLNTSADEWPAALAITVYDHAQPHLFFAHQRTIDSILSTPQKKWSQTETVAELRRLYADDPVALAEIQRFEREYYYEAGLYWYTRSSYICRAIRQAVQESNPDSMFKLRNLLTDIYELLDESHRRNHGSFSRNMLGEETYYHGRVMLPAELDAFKDLRHSVFSINGFLSTTLSLQVALVFACQIDAGAELVPVVFKITTEPLSKNRPYGSISQYSSFSDEEEVLFAMGSIFRVSRVYELRDSANVWIIDLTLVDLNTWRGQ